MNIYIYICIYIYIHTYIYLFTCIYVKHTNIPIDVVTCRCRHVEA